jgi:hypothetical protein
VDEERLQFEPEFVPFVRPAVWLAPDSDPSEEAKRVGVRRRMSSENTNVRGSDEG